MITCFTICMCCLALYQNTQWFPYKLLRTCNKLVVQIRMCCLALYQNTQWFPYKLLRTCNKLVVQIQLVGDLFAGLLKVVRFLSVSSLFSKQVTAVIAIANYEAFIKYVYPYMFTLKPCKFKSVSQRILTVVLLSEL